MKISYISLKFATCHPVYKLLLPHFKFQLAVNCRAREILIAPGGPVDDVMPLKIEVTFLYIVTINGHPSIYGDM